MTELPHVKHLGNFQYIQAMNVLKEIQTLLLPRLVNPAKKYGPMIEDLYWEQFHNRMEFSALVNAHLLPPSMFGIFLELEQICSPFIARYGFADWALRLPMLIEITTAPASHHVDTPVRDFVMNWYPFENYDHEIYFETGELIVPKQGDLFLFDVRNLHWTAHPNPGTVLFMSMSLRRI
jgi:hypothetical protein